ncbi:MAG TPA: RsmG family class I SAM-dependent methyltransferase [Acidimicrobiales bacterium]|jgi:16S rRNA (guanine527-N7)-methyltransferase|nr:RsmG family class I SAM-dependent methyltransferase [Acidimicrobiales bacterium]
MAEARSGDQADELQRRVPASVKAQLQRSAELDFLGAMPIDDQIDHALGFVWAVEEESGNSPGSVVDLGTGGGLPGLVLIACWPEASFVLIDSNQRRTDFLAEEIVQSGQGDRVSVVRARAEEAGRADELREHADLVVARSFGAPATTAECASPLLAVGGRAVVSEPPGEEAGERWDPQGLAQLGLQRGGRHRYQDRFGYQVLLKVEACDDRYPRRVGVPAKRPLF